MSCIVSEVTSLEDFRSLAAVEGEAYATPNNTFWNILEGQSIEECAERQWAWHSADPNSRWIKVILDGKLVGGAQWVINKEDPFQKPMPPIDVNWWPDNSDIKAITEDVLATFFAGRPHRMNRPHLLIGYCFVLPAYRRRGAGRALMEWGTAIADSMGLESFVESTEDGRALYESAGFNVVDSFFVGPRKEGGSQSYLKVVQEYFPEPQRGWFMWRPIGGKFIPGQTKYSWE